MGISGQIVQPSEPRHTSFTDGSGLRVVIPSRKRWFMILFLSVWLVGWAFFFLAILAVLVIPLWINTSSELFFEGSSFILFWLLAWIFGGLLALISFLWLIAGREVVQVDPRTISLRKEIFRVGRSKRYSLEHIKDFRIAPYVPGASGWGLRLARQGMVGGFLAFDYGAKTIHFGAGVDEAEAKQIYQKIVDQFPQYGSSLS